MKNKKTANAENTGMKKIEYSIGITEGGKYYIMMYRNKPETGHCILKDTCDGIDCVEKAIFFVEQHAQSSGVIPIVSVGVAPIRYEELGLTVNPNCAIYNDAYDEGRKLRHLSNWIR